MQKIKLFLLLTLFPVTLFAQIEIKGRIIDKNNSPVQLAEVIMLNLDSKAVGTTLTNEEGFFKIKLVSGYYSLKVK
ncbi:carboxypeptidase-like regulatory domain-containing protein [Flavobacterium davisii]|uniref:Carboxypeptidase regulatory-like domain-containing protein n=1 Tax=Flavobacterium columnare TaxID=996 RepID=A0A8G0KV50_9FLAO|nr:carboxypeptidase-like regulatory domain-containing protein [Flavobacterium davisii]QYS88989.1 carboxypeptidase regulatory-like domain-containing protein [Flavobacterium davisii]